ncbi:MAG: type IX secretion system protein PorQ [Bacteroidales bacterium]|nr:type IX secretion system protein PorQ [Bacteroidales bacterium]
MKKIIIIFSALVFSFTAIAQSEAGQESYAVLNLYNSAQMTARGMNFIPRFLKDSPSALSNPATLDSSLCGMFSLTYTDIFAGSYQGALAYSHSFKKLGNLGFGLQYIDYGSFSRTLANGDDAGEFSANDFMLNIAWGMEIEKDIYFGVNFKPLFSSYESYSSFSVAFDVSAMWASPSKYWQAGFIIKNIGRQIKSFANQRDTLPLDIQIGVSKQLKHAPLTFYIVADNLQKWDIRENDALNPRTTVEIDGTVKEEKKFSAFMDKTFRHLKFACDLKANRFIDLSLGYSYRQHKEMAVDDAFSMAGFSYGITVHYKKFTFNYARNEYHNYGSPNYITLSYTFDYAKKNQSTL